MKKDKAALYGGAWYNDTKYDWVSNSIKYISRYGDNFKTLPGMPLSNYLTNTQSPLNIDWVLNAETANQNYEIVNILTKKDFRVFIEKYPQLVSVTESDGKFNSSVTYFIKSNWVQVESTQFFDVYKAVE